MRIKKLDMVAEGNPVMDLLYTKDGMITSGGGSSTTVACVVSKLGLRSGIIGRTGDDEYGKQLRSELEEYGVDTSRLKRGGATSVNHILTAPSDRKIFRHYHTDAPPPDKEDFLYIGGSRSFYCRTSGGYFPEFARFCERNGIEVFASMQKFTEGDSYDPDSLLSPPVRIVFASEDEADTRIKKQNNAIIAVTEAERGCTIYHCGESRHFDAFPVNPKDPTGAGDTFAGAFIYSYLSGWNIERAARLANRLASVSTTEYGARTALRALEREGLEEILAAV